MLARKEGRKHTYVARQSKNVSMCL